MDTYGQIEIETLLERGESNVAVVFELSNMIVSWKNLIEHTLADVSALGQTNIYKNSLPGSTIEKALLTLRSFFISYLQDFASLHKELTENILQQVQKVNKDHQKQHESHASTIKKSTDLCNSSLLKLNDTKKKFQKSKIDFEKSKERYKSSEIEYQTIIKKSHEEDSTSNNITNPPIEILNNDSTPQTTHASSSSQSMSRLLAKRINNAYESNAKGALDRAQEVCLHKYNTMLQSLEEVKEAKQRYMELFQEHESIIDQVCRRTN